MSNTTYLLLITSVVSTRCKPCTIYTHVNNKYIGSPLIINNYKSIMTLLELTSAEVFGKFKTLQFHKQAINKGPPHSLTRQSKNVLFGEIVGLEDGSVQCANCWVVREAHQQPPLSVLLQVQNNGDIGRKYSKVKPIHLIATNRNRK